MRPTSFPRTGSFTALFQSSERTKIQPRTAIREKTRPMRTRTLGHLPTVAAVVLLALLLAPDAAAQQATAKILGTITDQQGLLVPDVKVTVTNTATNVSSETTTDKYGFYQVLNLPIGIYKITASHEGFRTLERTTAPLEINQALRVDLKMGVGAVSERVLVEGQAEAVETVNPTIGQSITSRPIVNMPLNGRNVLDLALLQPGVTEDNPDDTGAGHFSIGGGRADSVTFLLDGGVNNDLLDNGVVLNPNPDSIAEFRILTSDYTAEYGRNGAGVISVVTKSGTNQLHGSAFEFARNTAFDANSYFNIINGLPRNDLKRHQFGGTLGGPITIPHLLEGKDRYFFFVSYQGQRQTETFVQSDITTFTPAELQGNFSQAVAQGGTTLGGATCQNAAGCPDPNVDAFLRTNTWFAPANYAANCAVNNPSTWQNCATITNIDPAAQAYITTFNLQSITSPTGLISPAATGRDNNNELTIKLDFNFTAKDKLSVTVGGYRNPEFEPFPLNGADVTGFPGLVQNNNYLANFAYTRTFSPTLLNEFRVTAQRRYSLDALPPANLPTSASLGFGILSDLPNGPPLLTFDNGLAIGDSPQGPAYEIGNTFAFADTLTWVRGPNTWKLGVGFSAYQQNTLYDYYGDGDFGYSGYASNGDGTGNSLADFLVGAPNNLFEGANASNNFRSKALYGFAQDEWRARKNLTLTLGIRYEYSTPKIDTEGRTFSIVPGDQSKRFPYAPLGLVFPGDAGAPRGANFPDRDNFAPRIGFAWSPGSSNRTSVRGGFGIFYDVLKGEDNLQFNGAPPFYSEPYVYFPCLPSSQNQYCPSPSPSAPAYTSSSTPFYSVPWENSTTPFAQPFPSPGANPANAFNPCASSGYVCPFYNFLPTAGGSVYFVNPHLHTPYTYQYNLSVQHEVARNLVAEVNYVGSSSKGLTSLEDINPFDLSTVNGANPARILNEQQTNADLIAYCSPANFQSGPSACPFQNVSEFENRSFASFNSLEASLTKKNGTSRFFGNTYFTLGYTYGHSIDNASGFRNRDSQVPYYNIGQFRASSNFDLTHRITFSGGWDLPFGQYWATGPKRLVKGWSLYPILSWRTGFPLSVSSGLTYSFSPSDPGPSGAGDGYLADAVFAPGYSSLKILNPRHITSCNNANTGLPQTGNQYFDCGTFVAISDTPGSGYGLPRDFFRGPGRTNLDLALAKTTPITERVNTEFRLEAFNVFNHAEFANPDTNIYDLTFGQVTTTDFGTGPEPTHTERILQLALRLTF